MRIELSGGQVRDAIRNYLSDNYGLDIQDEDMEEMEHEFMYRSIAYKKYKNGKVMRDENGRMIVDEENTRTVCSSGFVDEYDSHFHFYLMPTQGES